MASNWAAVSGVDAASTKLRTTGTNNSSIPHHYQTGDSPHDQLKHQQIDEMLQPRVLLFRSTNKLDNSVTNGCDTSRVVNVNDCTGETECFTPPTDRQLPTHGSNITGVVNGCSQALHHPKRFSPKLIRKSVGRISLHSRRPRRLDRRERLQPRLHGFGINGLGSAPRHPDQTVRLQHSFAWRRAGRRRACSSAA